MGNLFGNRRAQELELQRAQAQVQNLTAQVQQLQSELQQKKDDKASNLEKWDWLEAQYQLKCRAAQHAQQQAATAQQRVEKLEEEVSGEQQINLLLKEHLEELESEFAAKNTEVSIAFYLIALYFRGAIFS